MRQDFEQLFAKLNQPEMPDGFPEKVFFAISAEKKRAERKRAVFFGMGAVLSLGAFIPAAITAFSNFKSSGFVQYVSLIFSDGGSVMDAGWQYIFAILESIPAASLGISLISAVLLAVSVKYFSGKLKINGQIIYG
jgi:hypothetical protein